MQSTEKQVNNIKTKSDEAQQSGMNTQSNSTNKSLRKHRMQSRLPKNSLEELRLYVKFIVIKGKVYTIEDLLSERGK